ncbi:MAG: hypothetical protein KGO23_15510, partial [Nitrospirota bacterium]|nr:hypothetical protein [Nitrospirota bacterium]
MIEQQTAELLTNLETLGSQATAIRQNLDDPKFKQQTAELLTNLETLGSQATAIRQNLDDPKFKQQTAELLTNLETLGTQATAIRQKLDDPKFKQETADLLINLITLVTKAAATTESKAEVGVLFVHGIGEQPKGDTLTRFGDPIIDWIERWLRRNDGSLRMDHSTLNTRGPTVMTPAHACFTTYSKPSQTMKTWIFAEAWWAEEFQRPPLGELALWLLTRGPWLILKHFSMPKHWGWWQLCSVIFFPISVIIAFMFQMIVFTCLIFAIIPIENVRATIARILLKVTGTIGDSYVWTESEIQRGAIITSVQRDLNWLSSKCDKLLVLAHSQGVAVAHKVLKSANDPRVDLFISFGSGLRKLHQLEIETEDRGYPSLAVGLFVLILGALIIASITIETEGWIWLIRAIAAFCVTVTFIIWLLEKDPDASKLKLQDARKGIKWINLFATSD